MINNLKYLISIIPFNKYYLLTRYIFSRNPIRLEKAYHFDDGDILFYGWMLGNKAQYKSISVYIDSEIISDDKIKLIKNPRIDIYNIFKKRNIDNELIGFSSVISRKYTNKYSCKIISIIAYDINNKQYISSVKIENIKNLKYCIKKVLNNYNYSSNNNFSPGSTYPVISAIWSSRKYSTGDLQIISFSKNISNPALTIIIPLYGRIDYIEKQMQIFGKDNDINLIDLIYVMDDPELWIELKNISGELYKKYELPFKIIYSGKNLGFAGANNLGMKYALSDKILFMNSDLFPKSVNWIKKLLNSYNTIPKNSILGAKLLYEDETIQHMGMKFIRHPQYNNLWINYHINKGLPNRLVKNSGLQEVKATTGALMLISRDYFLANNGFDDNFIIGDYEDSDLCLKILDNNGHIYIDMNIEFYHLERKSVEILGDKKWRNQLTLLNCFYQSSKWHKKLIELEGV